MANKRVKVLKSDLSVSGINNLIQQIKDYQADIEIKATLLAQELANEGVKIAKIYIKSLDAVFTSELLDSVHSEYVNSFKGGAIYCIKADSQHAVFVEFGTGMVGASNPYPGELPVMYAQGEHMFRTQDGRYGWIYYNEEWQQYVFTEGMPSRPFMHNTKIELIAKVEEIAKRIFQ